MKLYRTTSVPPMAVLCGNTDDVCLIVPWADLLDLRQIIIAASTEAGAWSIEKTGNSVALTHQATTNVLVLDAQEWGILADLLHVDDELLMQVEVAKLTGKLQQRIAEAIATGQLFAFQIAGLDRRQWRIPRREAERWAQHGVTSKFAAG